MRRAFLLAAGTGLAAVVGLTAYLAKTPADPPRPPEPPVVHAAPAPAAASSETSVQLPIGQVVLFSSGVGYFQREGQIEGDARVDLSFPVSDINDLIKSMVLRDLDGGHVSAVSYDSNAPVEKTLQSFAVNLSANPTFGQILNQARGEKVEVVLQQANAAQPGTMTGSIIGVEQKQEAVGKDVVNVEQLNLWCADGMRSVKLSELQRVRFLNPVMDNEVRKALETLTLSHDTQKKAVEPQLRGRGQAERAGGLRDREPHLEDELPARAGQRKRGQAVPARLGRGRERHRRGLEGRAHGAGERPAHQLPDGPVHAALRAAADGGARAVRLPTARHL